MKKVNLMMILAVMFIASSCVSTRVVGSFSMLNTRTVDTTKEYEPIAKGVGLTNEERKNCSSASIDEATNNLLKRYNGEYLMNVNVYMKAHDWFFFFTYRYYVSGDVYAPKKSN